MCALRDATRLIGLLCSIFVSKTGLHKFHLECANSWLAVATTCPLCKTSVLGNDSEGEHDEDDSEGQF